MDKIYKELARQHRESMSLDELRLRLNEVQVYLDELTKIAKKQNTNTINVNEVIERLTQVLIGVVNA